MMLRLRKVLKEQKSACKAFVAFLFLFFLILSCATYNTITDKARLDMESRNFSTALKHMEKACENEEKNRLLCLYDMGMIQYLNKDFEGAIKTWTRADDFSSQIDVVSISEQGLSLLLDDNTVAYRGEHHEKILNSLYLALSYLQLGKLESVLVECRRMNHKHNVLEQENQKKYKQNAFAKYLSGKMFEAQNQYNDAFIYYREADELMPGVEIIQEDILRMAEWLGFEQEYFSFKKKFGINAPNYDKKMGELVIIFENGLSPKKISDDVNIMINLKLVRLVSPKYVSRSNSISHAVIKIKNIAEDEKVKNEELIGAQKFRTYNLNDIGIVAKEQLNDRLKIRAAKMAGGFIAKEAISAGISKATDNELIGALVGFGLQAMQRADTRSWLSLPDNLQVGRSWLKPGQYHFKLDFYNKHGNYLYSADNFQPVKIDLGKKTFVTWRTFE